MDCTCGHDHEGCCFMPLHGHVHAPEGRCTCAPCSAPAVVVLEDPEPRDEPWRRLYCAEHWTEDDREFADLNGNKITVLEAHIDA